MDKPAKLPSKSLQWPIDWAGVELIARAEGCRLDAYQCPAGVWTIGWGATGGVRSGMRWTQAEADARLCADLTKFTGEVRRLLTRPANPNQLSAMVSLAYNIGIAGFAKSTVRRAHNAGDAEAAARAFGLWNKAAGRVLRGLTARRARESALYLTPVSVLDEDEMPQQVEPETSLVRSPLAQSGAVASATGGVAVVAQVAQDVRSTADSIQVTPTLIISTLALVIGIVVLWQRYKQRMQGWA